MQERRASLWVRTRLVSVVHYPLNRPPATFSPLEGEGTKTVWQSFLYLSPRPRDFSGGGLTRRR